MQSPGIRLDMVLEKKIRSNDHHDHRMIAPVLLYFRGKTGLLGTEEGAKGANWSLGNEKCLQERRHKEAEGKQADQDNERHRRESAGCLKPALQKHSKSGF
jgi:hypothetical protein